MHEIAIQRLKLAQIHTKYDRWIFKKGRTFSPKHQLSELSPTTQTYVPLTIRYIPFLGR